MSDYLDTVKWNGDGLVPAIAQDAATGEVLMLAWMNREALARTVQTREATYWSRSRSALWRKGETSGHTQRVLEIRLDCDADAVLLRIEQSGGIACHTGRRRCFFNRLVEGDGTPHWEATDAVLVEPGSFTVATEDHSLQSVLARLERTIGERRREASGKSWVATLNAKGLDAILKKVGEEATETVIAAKSGERGQLVHEVADLWFHCLVLLERQGIRLDEVLAELARREGRSGIEEKASREGQSQ